MLIVLDSRVLDFNLIKELYTKHPKFSSVIDNCDHGTPSAYKILDGFLFKENRLCSPKSSFKELLVQKTYDKRLASHFEINKTLEIL